ncbi:MAG TPA: SDR family oxidoreductase [Bacteroidota bacterium]|jgi:putative NADH-flavin reductase|nr:SDR family oxidoreductase [Bacteroidota bacterium]
MNVAIFGASGSTGQEITRQALAKGYSVTAFVRTPGKLDIQSEHLNIVQGDVSDIRAVEKAVRDQDAVISALGVSQPLKNDPFVVQGVGNIVEAMDARGTRRIIYLSFIGVGESRAAAGFLIRNVIARIVRNEIADHAQKEAIVRASGLDWTIIHPPKLTGGRATGKYRTGEDIASTSFLATMSRADVADFIVQELADNSYIRKTARILY